MRRRIQSVISRLTRHLWRRRTVIGIGVSADRLRAVAVRCGKARWCVEIERAVDTPLAEQIVGLLRSSPAARQRPRPPVMLAVPPQHSQLKKLENLPQASNRLLQGVVRESIARFFRKNGVPLAVGGVERVPDGVWAAAYEVPFLNQIADGCWRLNLRLHAACPSVLLAARTSPDHAVRWHDDSTEYEVIKAGDGNLVKIRVSSRSNIASQAECSPSLDEGLESLGCDAWRLADAFGAACYATQEPIAIRPSTAVEFRSRHRTRIAVAALACLGTWSAVALIRIVSVRTEVAAARRELLRVSPARLVYDTAVAELARATRQLDALARFDAQRGRITTMLAELAIALPPSSAITALHVDSAGGTVVGIAPRASSLVEALERVPSIGSVEILGPIGHDALPPAGGSASSSVAAAVHDVERVTLRFRLVHVVSRR